MVFEKGFMKDLNLFQLLQRSVKIKIYANFFSTKTLSTWDGKG